MGAEATSSIEEIRKNPGILGSGREFQDMQNPEKSQKSHKSRIFTVEVEGGFGIREFRKIQKIRDIRKFFFREGVCCYGAQGI